MTENLECFLDGNALCIVKKDFINLMESDAIFVELDDAELDAIKRMEDEIAKETKL